MPATYAPASHSGNVTAKAGTQSVQGLSPGRTFVTINDQWAPAYVFVPSSTTSDGYPSGMVPITTGTGTVT